VRVEGGTKVEVEQSVEVVRIVSITIIIAGF
jgi:hypothetical protein